MATEVKFVFDWPDGLQARVSYTKRKGPLSVSGDGPRRQTTRYTLSANKRADGILISFDDISLDPQAIPPGLPENTRKEMELMVRAAMPAFVVRNNGDFDRIDDIERFRSGVRSFLRSTLLGGKDGAELEQVSEKLTNEVMLTSLASSEWNTLVGMWAGVGLDVGETYDFPSSASLPLAPQLTVKMLWSVILKRELTCYRGSTPHRCAEIEATIVPDPLELKSAVQTFVQSLSRMDTAKKMAGSFDGLEMDMKQIIRVTLEPDGLIPHAFSNYKTIHVRTHENGDDKSQSVVEDVDISYNY